MTFNDVTKKCELMEQFHNYFDKKCENEQKKQIIIDDNNLKLNKETFTNLRENFVTNLSDTKSKLIKNSLLESKQYNI